MVFYSGDMFLLTGVKLDLVSIDFIPGLRVRAARRILSNRRVPTFHNSITDPTANKGEGLASYVRIVHYTL